LETATSIVEGLTIYFWIGLGVSALFLLVGIDRIDPGSRSSYIFRPLLIPGIIVLWPLVLLRWMVLEFSDGPSPTQRTHRRSHGRVWLVFSVLVPAVLVGAMLIRQQGPMEAPAVLLEAPPAAAEGSEP